MSSDRRPGTRLPDDPAYWDDLVARSVDAAFGEPASEPPAAHARGSAREPWWHGVSDAAFVLAATAVLALFGGTLLLDERSPHATTDSSTLAGPLAPDDPLLGSLLSTPAESPPATVLLKLLAVREEAR